jgi:hypothetical protein
MGKRTAPDDDVCTHSRSFEAGRQAGRQAASQQFIDTLESTITRENPSTMKNANGQRRVPVTPYLMLFLFRWLMVKEIFFSSISFSSFYNYFGIRSAAIVDHDRLAS